MSKLIKPITEEYEKYYRPDHIKNLQEIVDIYIADVGEEYLMTAKNRVIKDLNQIFLKHGDKYGFMDRSKVADITGVLLEEVTEHIKSLNDPYFK
jgi:soluble P-type ATPase